MDDVIDWPSPDARSIVHPEQIGDLKCAENKGRVLSEALKNEALAAWYILRQRISLVRYGAVGLIFLSNFIMAGGDTFSGSHSMGIMLLLIAAALYTTQMIGIKHWGFEWQDVLVTVAVVNGLLFIHARGQLLESQKRILR